MRRNQLPADKQVTRYIKLPSLLQFVKTGFDLDKVNLPLPDTGLENVYVPGER